MALSIEFKIGTALTLFLAAALATGPPWWFQYFRDGTAAASENSPVSGMSGGCEPFQVFAQNRWDPVGTAIRERPNVLSNQVGSFPANMSISVNGWVHGRSAYPTNPPPWDSDVWYHLSNNTGWVSFPGVRAYPTSHDPTGQAEDGGPTAAVASECEGSVR